MSSKKLKIVGKDDLRRLMKEKTSTTKSKIKRIESPLAKYNTLGQLVCIVCNSQVKSEILWNAHLQGRSHKENVAKLKEHKINDIKVIKNTTSAINSNAVPQKSILKRKHSEVPAEVLAKVSKVAATSTITNNKLGLGGYSSDSDDDTNDKPTPSTAKVPTSLPSDFFDSSVKPEPTEQPEETAVSKDMAEKLPEGFFDDPKTDAKVREVEYKDKMEEEWALFQKTVKEEAKISEAIVEEEDDNAVIERNLDEVDEQMHHWSKVNELEKKKEEIMSKKMDNKECDSDDDSDVDEQEFEEFLDWRSKKAWK